MYNVSLQQFNAHSDTYGSLVAVEALKNLPFDLKRVYYIFGVEEGVRRGFHAHLELRQALICVHGSVKILVKNPYEEENVLLDDPSKALLIGPMIWREMYDFSPGAVLLVLANEHYTEDDYLRHYEDYEAIALRWFAEHPEGIPETKEMGGDQ